MTTKEKMQVREYVCDLWEHRNGRNATIKANGEVHITIDGDGSQMVNGRDVSGGRIFAGWVDDLLSEVQSCNQED